MASIISTKTSGGGGIAVTGDTSGIMQLASNNGTTAVTIDASQNVGIGTASPSSKLTVGANPPAAAAIAAVGSSGGLSLALSDNVNSSLYVRNASGGAIIGTDGGGNLRFATNGTTATEERMRIDSSGLFMFNTTSQLIRGDEKFRVDLGTGLAAYQTSTSNYPVIHLKNSGTNGYMMAFNNAGGEIGTISSSGGTVSYNSFAGSHWSQLQDGSKPEILRGTVLESIDELVEWPNEPLTERLCKAKISDTVASKKVYGVFMDWDEGWTATNDLYVTSVGAFICRINKDVTVQSGDLLESNGDGTARVQSDDIIRSSTIGKVTSNVKTHEYDDGSYCVPTVLYCG